jgi:hypothetical protein
MVIETSRVEQQGESSTSTPDLVPAEHAPPDHDRGSSGGKEEGKGRGRHDREEPGEHARKVGAPNERRHRDGSDKVQTESGDRGHLAQAPSLTRVLLYSGLVALVCGVVGGWGYSYFFSSKSEGKEFSDKHANSKELSDSSARKSSGAESGEGSGRMSESGEEYSGSTGVGDVDGLREKVESLSKQVDNLRGRIDSLAMPRDHLPPDIRKLQIKVSDLARAAEKMGDPPAHFRRIEDRLEELSQQLKALRPQVPATQGTADGSTAPTPRSSGLTSPAIQSGKRH